LFDHLTIIKIFETFQQFQDKLYFYKITQAENKNPSLLSNVFSRKGLGNLFKKRNMIP